LKTWPATARNVAPETGRLFECQSFESALLSEWRAAGVGQPFNL
jgi:hypothetical protein